MSEQQQQLTHPQMVPNKVWQQLSQALKQEPHILNTRTDPDDLKTIYSSGLAIILVNNHNDPIGFIVAWSVARGYIEIGSAWVEKNHRGRGLGKYLFTQIQKLPSVVGKKIFLVSQNEIAIATAQTTGMITNTDWQSPIPWELTCGPCDIVADNDKPNCSLRNKSCVLCLQLN